MNDSVSLRRAYPRDSLCSPRGCRCRAAAREVALDTEASLAATWFLVASQRQRGSRWHSGAGQGADSGARARPCHHDLEARHLRSALRCRQIRDQAHELRLSVRAGFRQGIADAQRAVAGYTEAHAVPIPC